MARDFAKRAPSPGQRSRNGRGAARSAGNRRRSSGRRSADTRPRATRPGFHGPSFSAGVVLGGLLVGLAWLAPELLRGDEVADAGDAQAQEPARSAARPEVTFTFDDELRNSEVLSHPEDYPALFTDPEEPAAIEYVLQAASFRDVDDANALRASLMLQALPARVSEVRLDNGRWYRVTVGPFSSRVEAQRALTRLREENLGAVLHQRDAGG